MLIERYTQIVLSQPGAPFPLQRLAQLYRDRDGNLAKLVKDFETRAAQAGAEQYAAIGHARRHLQDRRPLDDAVATYETAIALKGDDAAALLALAHLHQDRGEIAPARAALRARARAADGAGRQGADAPHAHDARARRRRTGTARRRSTASS